MNKILFLLFFISFSSFAQIGLHQIISQKEIEKDGFELWKGKEKTQICGKTKGVISVSGSAIFLDIWQLPPTTICNSINADSTFQRLELKDGRKKFGDPTKVLSFPLRSFTFGLNAFPFRYRFKFDNNKISYPASTLSAFQLAISVGRVWGKSYITTRSINNYTFSANLFFGPSSATLDKNNVKSSKIATELGSSTQNNAALSYGLNFIFARNNIGLVIGIGKDRAIGKNGSEWIYNNKPWIGFGVNTGFLR